MRKTEELSTPRLARFEETEENTACDQMSPISDESHSQHDRSPEDGDSGKENTRSDLANEQVGR